MNVSDSDLALLDSVAKQMKPSEPELEDWFRLYARAQKRRLAEDIEMVRSWTRRGWRILEVGSTPMLLTTALSEMREVVGVDIDPFRFAGTVRERNLKMITCDIETDGLPFADATFDCVLFNELFEHLRINPPVTLGEVGRVIKPGGLLLLSTPNLYSFRGLVNLLLKQRSWAVGAEPLAEYRKLTTLGHMGHVREYTLRETIGVLTGCGFEVRHVVHRGTPSSRIERAVTMVWPRLLPVASVIATAAAGEPHHTDPEVHEVAPR